MGSLAASLMGSCARMVQHRLSRAQGSGLSEGTSGVSVRCPGAGQVHIRGLASPYSPNP